jgi:hypothetical protein
MGDETEQPGQRAPAADGRPAAGPDPVADPTSEAHEATPSEPAIPSPDRSGQRAPRPPEALERLSRQWESYEPIGSASSLTSLELTVPEDPRGFDYLGALTGDAPATVATTEALWRARSSVVRPIQPRSPACSPQSCGRPRGGDARPRSAPYPVGRRSLRRQRFSSTAGTRPGCLRCGGCGRPRRASGRLGRGGPLLSRTADRGQVGRIRPGLEAAAALEADLLDRASPARFNHRTSAGRRAPARSTARSRMGL